MKTRKKRTKAKASSINILQSTEIECIENKHELEVSISFLHHCLDKTSGNAWMDGDMFFYRLLSKNSILMMMMMMDERIATKNVSFIVSK